MSAETTRAAAEAEIRKLIDDWQSAARARQVDRIMSHYAPDVVAYDAILALQFKGAEAYGKHWQACMEMCPGEMIFEIHDLTVAVGEDLAFAHFLTRCGVVDPGGTEKASWMRGTACYRKSGGTWRIVHEHFSAPFDVATGKALFDLQP